MTAVATRGLPRLLAGIDRDGDAVSLAAHEALHSPLPSLRPEELVSVVDRSGLRGRGGADFPTAIKLRTFARAKRRPAAVIVNGSETEPLSRKDATLLGRVPHLVLDGAILVAEAIGAPEVVVKLSDSADPATIAIVEAAIALRSKRGLNVWSTVGPAGYVTGEETAVINWIGREDARPTFVPPRPWERGYRGRPTLVQNVETLAQLALLARYGDRWFRQLGTDADPGSLLLSVSGAVTAPGVQEVAFGTGIDDVLAAADGAAEPIQALLIGGYFGTWVAASRALSLRLSRAELRNAGCSLGSGVILALGESTSGLAESAEIVTYLASQSAGQCGPCVHGLAAIADAMHAIAGGDHRERDRLLRWCAEISGRGACHHPTGAVRFVESALAVFDE
jgi:NADH:ubiquinone oxidoreductase subunit F (NADH-binding)